MESGSVRTAVANRAVRYCERCGAASPRGAGYCASCGVALPPLHEEVVHSRAGSVPKGRLAWRASAALAAGVLLLALAFVGGRLTRSIAPSRAVAAIIGSTATVTVSTVQPATSTAAPVTVTVTTTAGPLVANTIDGDPLVSARLEGNPPVPMAAVQYLEDQARGDGQAAWDELSVAAQQQIAQQGGSAVALTQELQRSPLPPILQITFAGGSTMIDGREAAVFIVTANVADTQRQVPYYFHQYQGPDSRGPLALQVQRRVPAAPR
jgi:hypothetical protein